MILQVFRILTNVAPWRPQLDKVSIAYLIYHRNETSFLQELPEKIKYRIWITCVLDGFRHMQIDE